MEVEFHCLEAKMSSILSVASFIMHITRLALVPRRARPNSATAADCTTAPIPVHVNPGPRLKTEFRVKQLCGRSMLPAFEFVAEDSLRPIRTAISLLEVLAGLERIFRSAGHSRARQLMVPRARFGSGKYV